MACAIPDAGRPGNHFARRRRPPSPRAILDTSANSSRADGDHIAERTDALGTAAVQLGDRREHRGHSGVAPNEARLPHRVAAEVRDPMRRTPSEAVEVVDALDDVPVRRLAASRARRPDVRLLAAMLPGARIRVRQPRSVEAAARRAGRVLPRLAGSAPLRALACRDHRGGVPPPPTRSPAVASGVDAVIAYFGAARDTSRLPDLAAVRAPRACGGATISAPSAARAGPSSAMRGFAPTATLVDRGCEPYPRSSMAFAVRGAALPTHDSCDGPHPCAARATAADVRRGYAACAATRRRPAKAASARATSRVRARVDGHAAVRGADLGGSSAAGSRHARQSTIPSVRE